jgi:hypothetical protein
MTPHELYLGLGVGGMERLASYPGTLWTLLVGSMTLAGVQVAQ